MIRVREHLLNLDRDVQVYDSREGLLRLDMNEYLPCATDILYRELYKRITPEIISGYPMVNSAYKALSKLINEPINKIVLTNGSDGVIFNTLMTFCNPGDSIMYVEPTYGMYSVYAQMMNLREVKLLSNIKDRIDVNSIIERINKDIKVFIVANPNGVFGGYFEKTDIIEILEKAKRTETIVLIDEVYAAFVDGGYSRLFSLTEKYENLIVARSFSKSYGLAGIRLGYSVSNIITRKALISTRSNVEINSVAVEAAKIWCENPQLLRHCIDEINRSKKHTVERFRRFGIDCIECEGNFILVRVNHISIWKKFFEEEKICVKWIDVDGAVWMRITIGSSDYMNIFWDKLEQSGIIEGE